MLFLLSLLRITYFVVDRFLSSIHPTYFAVSKKSKGKIENIISYNFNAFHAHSINVNNFQNLKFEKLVTSSMDEVIKVAKKVSNILNDVIAIR